MKKLAANLEPIEPIPICQRGSVRYMLRCDPAGFPYELYDLTKDWTQFDNVAAKYPEKLKEPEHLFWIEANKYQVLPLDATVATRIVGPRPNLAAGRTAFTWSGEISVCVWGWLVPVKRKSNTFRAAHFDGRVASC
jgi:hypothetical protein